MQSFAVLFTLFITAFGAATFLPVQSEILLLALARQDLHSVWTLLVVASLGNVLGSLLNWYLGCYINIFAHRRWFPIRAKAIDRASLHYQRWGKWSLLLAWLPFVGDPLTLAAGIFRTPLIWFLPLVAIGKVGRYAVLLAIV